MQVGARPVVIARRWDQLGTRLSAIVNARVLAELLDLEFRFAWPPSADATVANLHELFSESFLARDQIEPEEVQERRCITYHELIGLSPADREALLRSGSNAVIEMDELFGMVRAEGDDDGTAQHRYRRCFESIGWNDEVRRLIELTARSEQLAGRAAVHVRAGDIISGAWRQSITHQKYEPAPYVRQTLAVFTGEGRPVLVLSDSAEYLDHLQRRFPGVLAPKDLLPGYERLTESQRALADILALSRCDPIVGPPASTFSKLGGNLGGSVVARADTLAPAGGERDVLLAGIAEGEQLASRSDFWRRLTARDICWCLDVFGDTLALGEQRELAGRAVALDPDFCGALSRFGRIAALGRRKRAAARATARAISLAERVERHDDPIFEALVSDLIVRILGWNGRRASAPHDALESRYQRCQALAPFWFERDQILAKLSYLIDVARALDPAGYTRRRRAIRALRVEDDAKLRTPHEDGLTEHRSQLLFDPLLRELDGIELHIRRAFRELDLELPR